MRFLSGRAVSLTHTFLDDESVLDVPSASVTVRSAVGVTVASGPATKTGESWTFALSAQPVGRYEVTWVAGAVATDVTEFEIVGRFLFSVPEVRSSDVDLASVTRFPAAEIRAYREVVEEEFQTITGRSFVPRVARLGFIGDGTQSVILPLFDPTSVVAIEGPEGELATVGWLMSTSGFLTAPYELTEGASYVITVAYGLTFPPEDIKRAGMLRLRHLLAAERSSIPERATAFVSAEGGNFTLAVAGRNGYETGLPDVDAILNRYKFRILNDVVGV